MGIAARAGGKQIGNSINDSEAMFGGRGGDGTDQLIEERSAIARALSYLVFTDIGSLNRVGGGSKQIRSYRKIPKPRCTRTLKKKRKILRNMHNNRPQLRRAR
jgi:hypothetical protein